MARGSRKNKKANSKRAQGDSGLRKFTADVPLFNNDPTVVFGKIIGGMPNASRMARGGLRRQRGARGG